MVGFISKPLSSLLSTVSKWVEFNDGLTSPVSGSIQLDPATGLPLDVQVAQLVQEGPALSVAGSRTTVGVLFKVNMGAYKSITAQINSVGVGGSVIFETSTDDVTYFPISGVISSAASTGASSSTTSVGTFRFPKHGSFFQVRLTAITSGTVTAVGELFTSEATFPSVGVGGTAFGVTGDTAWDLSNANASMISLLKKCALLLEAIRVKP